MKRGGGGQEEMMVFRIFWEDHVLKLLGKAIYKVLLHVVSI